MKSKEWKSTFLFHAAKERLLYGIPRFGHIVRNLQKNDIISSEELKRVISPLKMEIDKFYEKIGNNEFNEELDKKINSLDSVIAHGLKE